MGNVVCLRPRAAEYVLRPEHRAALERHLRAAEGALRATISAASKASAAPELRTDSPRSA